MLRIQRPAEVIQQYLLRLVLLEVLQIPPFLGLGFLDESKEHRRIKAPLGIKVVFICLGVPCFCEQMILDGGFEGFFAILSRHQETSLRTSILPVYRRRNERRPVFL